MVETMRKRGAWFLGVAAMAMGLFLSPVPAKALVIDFSYSGMPVPQLTFSGGQVTGVNIPIVNMNADSGPQAGDHAVTFGRLDFSTITGAFTIIGAVPDLGLASAVTLLSGTIANFAVLGPIFSALGPDTKNPDLLTALGFSPSLGFNYAGISIGVNCVGGVCNTGSVDVSNSSVPEPATLLLLGSGLLGAGLKARRRTAQKA